MSNNCKLHIAAVNSWHHSSVMLSHSKCLPTPKFDVNLTFDDIIPKNMKLQEPQDTKNTMNHWKESGKEQLHKSGKW